jgi:hypothetical protein
VNVVVNTKNTPVPNGTDANMGTIQCTRGYVVNANQ